MDCGSYFWEKQAGRTVRYVFLHTHKTWGRNGRSENLQWHMRENQSAAPESDWLTVRGK